MGNREHGSEGSDTAKSNDKLSNKFRKHCSAHHIGYILEKLRFSWAFTLYKKKKNVPREIRIWDTILGCQKCRNNSIETRISKCVTNIVRHHDQDERETDGAMHWDVHTPSIERETPKSTVKGIRKRGPAPLPISWKLQDEV